MGKYHGVELHDSIQLFDANGVGVGLRVTHSKYPNQKVPKVMRFRNQYFLVIAERGEEYSQKEINIFLFFHSIISLMIYSNFYKSSIVFQI